MSDYRAIAAITVTLQQILQTAVNQAQLAAVVKTGPPSKDVDTSGEGAIHIFLYQVEHNAYLRNVELPVRDAEGRLVQLPTVALNLHYLLTFYGDDSRQIPQLLLGSTVTALHAFPFPGAPEIAAAERAFQGPELAGSGLVEQANLLRFVPIPLSHDEMSRLWSVFFQVPYALSVAYRCAVLLMSPDGLTPQAPALPVRRVHLSGGDPPLPQVELVTPPAIETGGSQASELLLRGRNLGSRDLAVLIGGRPATVLRRSPEEMSVIAPSGLAPGAQPVEVVRNLPLGRPPELHALPQADPAWVLVLPRIRGFQPSGGVVDPGAEPILGVEVDPPVGLTQRVALLLNPVAGEGTDRRSFSLAPEGDSRTPSQLHFDLSEVSRRDSGSFLARLWVDGVTSRLATDDTGRSIAPRVVIQ